MSASSAGAALYTGRGPLLDEQRHAPSRRSRPYPLPDSHLYAIYSNFIYLDMDRIMPPEDFETLLSFFKALADKSRLRVIGLLAERERTVEELATLLELKPPTMSHHLSRLKAVGLVEIRAEGTTRHYRLVTERLDVLSKEVFAPDAMARATEGVAPHAWEDKVLSTFIVDEKLVKIPSSTKKRLVILERLVDDFELGRAYDELEINAILLQRYWDSATLRRELIGCGLMTRARGIYERVPQGDLGRPPAG